MTDIMTSQDLYVGVFDRENVTFLIISRQEVHHVQWFHIRGLGSGF
jgi:uncharacterized protein YhbP (UPF0306 family)